MRFSPILLLVLLAGCREPAEPFTFALLADPHIAGRAESERRLEACVAWINERGGPGAIELAFVLGDIGWGEGKLARAREILDRLDVPYVPVIGDNEVTSGYEADFEAVFGPQYEILGRELAEWRRAPTPVPDPTSGKDAWLQNFAFTHKGVRFVGLDWTTRRGGETADLHDYAGGTWGFLVEELATSPERPRERIVMLSHLPMHRNLAYEVFAAGENARLQELIGRHADLVHANYAGHYHIDFAEPQRGGYQVVVRDATWDDDATVTVVKVLPEGGAFTYHRATVAMR